METQTDNDLNISSLVKDGLISHFDIIVVGGGLVGCAFALDLAVKNHKFTIAILERKCYSVFDATGLDNRIYAISPHNIDYLNELGIVSDEARSGTIWHMNVSGDDGGNILFDSDDTRQLYLAKTVEYHILQEQLYNKLRQLDNVTFIYDELTALDNMNQTATHATLIGKAGKYTANLIVGADGANSFVRQQAHMELNQYDYGAHGVVANFACEYPHNHTAYQWFNNGEILAYLPLAGNQISIVWSTNKYLRLLELKPEELAVAVANAGNNCLGKLELITPAVAFPLRLYTLERVYINKIVLIGDAAHTIHPLAGQGVNLGFGDAKLLAKLLTPLQNYQLGDTAVLARFNALRLPHVYKMQLVCHYLYRLFETENSVLKRVRNRGLNWVNRLALIKKHIINQAVSY